MAADSSRCSAPHETSWRRPRDAPTEGGEGTARRGNRIVGALATVHPTNAVLLALSEAVPQLASALSPLITAVGEIIAAMTDPLEMAWKR